MNWFYAENGQQKGPVSDSDLASLAENGLLKAETLLWREGMSTWMPLGQVRPDLAAVAGTPMLGGVAVPEQTKDVLVQQLREGVIGELTAPGALRYVGFWWRLLAWIIDYIVQFVAQQIIQLLVMAVLALGSFGAMGNETAAGVFAVVIGIVAVVLMLGVNAWYHTWMVVRFGGTLGKMALGFKVVTSDGTKLRWPRALGRWAVTQVLNWLILFVIVMIPILLVLFIGMSAMGEFGRFNGDGLAVFWMFGMFAAGIVGSLVGAFPWWMAGLDKEKRALHDRICATRVVWK